MFGLHMIVKNRLEHLDEEKQEHVGATQQLAVLSVGLTVADEHPQPLHDLALKDDTCLIVVKLVPDALSDTLDELQVFNVLIERSGGVLVIPVLRQLFHCALVVNNKKPEEFIHALQIDGACEVDGPRVAHTHLSTSAEGLIHPAVIFVNKGCILVFSTPAAPSFSTDNAARIISSLFLFH